MDEKDKIKAKIRKLLALSKSPNENEAMAALEKAKELMEEYSLNQQSCIYENKKVKSTKTECPWRNLTANAIVWLYNCYKYKDASDGTFVFVGEEFDAFMASEMYSYLIKTIERMAKQNIRKNAKYVFRRSYKQGIARRLYTRIMELGKSCSWAPERESKIKAVSDFVEKEVDLVDIKPKKIKTKTNWTALSKGFKDAESISLNRQATGHGGRFIEGEGNDSV